MPSSFDPYYKWLGIAPREQPANHYRLLSLPLFEDDPVAIERAADRQLNHLQTYLASNNRQFAVALIREIVAVKACLLDTESKAAYDELLKCRAARHDASKAPRVTASNDTDAPQLDDRATGRDAKTKQPITESARRSPESRSHIAEADVVAIRPRVSRYSLGRKYTRRSRSRWIVNLFGWLFGGIIGLAAGYLILCIIDTRYDFLHLLDREQATQRSESVASSNPQSQISSPLTRKAENEAGPRNKRARDVANLDANELGETAEPIGPESPQPPVPLQPIPAALRPVTDDSPRWVDIYPLPPGERVSLLPDKEVHIEDQLELRLVPIGEVDDLDSAWSIRRVPNTAEWIILEPGFDANPIDPGAVGGDKAENAANDLEVVESPPVGRVVLDQGALRFEWIGDPIAEVRNALANQSISVTHAGREIRVALRSPIGVSANTIDLEMGVHRIICSAKNLPSDEALRVDVSGCDTFPPSSLDDESLRGLKLTDKATMKFDGYVEGMAGEIRFIKRGTVPIVEFEVRYRLPSGGKYTLKASQVKTQARTLERKLRAIANYRQSLPAARRHLTVTLPSQLTQMQSITGAARLPNGGWVGLPNVAAERDARIVQIQQEMVAQRNRIARMEKIITTEPVALKDVEALKSVIAVAERIHQIGKLKARFYALAGDKQVELAVSE